MTPTSLSSLQDPAPGELSSSIDRESVVISGMSGAYPQARNVQELSDILYNKVNPITDKDCRWQYESPELSRYSGKIPELDKFDAQFFKVHYRQAPWMDPVSRLILEHTFQAIYDAGINSESLRGKKIGVYIGTSYSETEKAAFYSSRLGYVLGLTGCSKTMFANRISYWLNVKGPSVAIDQSSCSSIAALDQAYQAISQGRCEAAIVGSGHINLHPQFNVQYGKVIKLSADDKTKSFDQDADGCTTSEAINILFLQKAKDALRIYAEIIHVKNEYNDIYKDETIPIFGFYRDPLKTAEFLKHFYQEAGVPPGAVEYIEAFGSATPEADKAELEVIDEVFCENRNIPLLVGSVMSNIGFSESSSGISAITKVLLGYEKGELAANLHCSNPRRDVAALRDGRIQIVTEHERFNHSYAAVNNISGTGVHAHILLKGHYKLKASNDNKSTIPHLVNICGRQETSVQRILDDLKSRPIDPEELALLHNIHQTKINSHLGRGYTILDTNEEQKTVSRAEKATYFDEAKRSLWFVYSGMGSQWTGMGTQLMRIPIFASAIDRCQKVLEPKGVDVVKIITSPDKTTFDNILNSFVGIAAIQIGLTDILTAVGLVPDKIIGHSVGELGCAYADGCFTAEEMILAAYSRGLVSVQTPFIRGSMAAVGVGYKEVSKMIPPEIEVACHNGPNSSTISGPADVMREFVARLLDQDIFAKEVPCSNIPYHSRYISEAGPDLLRLLSDVIKTPKERSERWVSTSVPQDKWDQSAAKYSSAEYHTNNLLNPVLFEETSRLVPENAVLVEIAPSGLLQAILKRSLPETCQHIPLTRRGHADNAFFVLDAIGKLFLEGYNPRLQVLYPKVDFPVASGTPMLSHLIEWNREETWDLILFLERNRKCSASCCFVLSLHDEEHSYLRGHVIRGKILYPFSAALVAAWDTLAMSLSVPKKQLSVEFRDVHFFAQPVLHDQRQLNLNVELQKGSGRFEIMDGDCMVATGFILSELKADDSTMTLDCNELMTINSDDVYQLMFDRDYFYSDAFRSIHKANSSLTEAQILWNNNWVTFIDGIIQLNALRDNHNTVSQPSYIRRIFIDVTNEIKKNEIQIDDNTVMFTKYFEIQDKTRCGGIEMECIKFRRLPTLIEDKVTFKSKKFIPHFLFSTDITTCLQVYLQIVSENLSKEVINIVEIVHDTDNLTVYSSTIKNLSHYIPGMKFDYNQIRSNKVSVMKDYFLKEVDLVLVQNLSTDDTLCQMLHKVLTQDTFVINKDRTKENRLRPSMLYRVVCSFCVKQADMNLIRWKPSQISAASTVASVRTRSDLEMLTTVRRTLPQPNRLVVFSCYPAVTGLIELVKEWRRESDCNRIHVVMTSEKDTMEVELLPNLDLTFNILYNGVLGGEYYTSVEENVSATCGGTLRSARTGGVDSLHWAETSQPVGGGVPVQVHYAAINDTDVKRLTGVALLKKSSCDSVYGMDFSGVTESGERVMGVVPVGAASTRVAALPELMWPVPEHWSLEDAATVPSAYAHAFYCLALKFPLLHLASILVHGGAGALGQAVISIALASQLEVFTTVSTVHKKRFLMRLFPELKENHIGNSRDSSFEYMIKEATKGKGCSKVICCLEGELKNISFNCSAGVTIDTVFSQNSEAFACGLYSLTKERSIVKSDFSSIFENQDLTDMKRLQALISDGIARGYVRPLSRVTYPAHEAPRAFRLQAASRHRGRVLLRLHDAASIIQPRLTTKPDRCHLLLCGEGYFGLQWAERLCVRGVKNILLHYVNPPSYLYLKIQSWNIYGVKVKVSCEDLSDNKGISKLLDECNRLGPIEGVYVLATSVSDGTVDKLTTVVGNLDLATRDLLSEIKYFAIIASGNTNAIGYQTCVSRARDGFPATHINLQALRNYGDIEGATNKDVLSWRSALDAIEQVLRSEQQAVLVYRQQVEFPSLLLQIAAIADIFISKETDESATLVELGMDVVKAPAVNAFISDMYNISLLAKNIPTMTIQKIRNLEESISICDFKQVQGLNLFYSFVDSNELLATMDMIFMPTLTNNAAMKDDDYDVSQIYLCIVPGMEGHHKRFRFICERLKLPALVLQPGLDRIHETLRETAERFAEILLKKMNPNDKFYLLGYESGVLVALEMSAVMEDRGLTGTVFCIGGTPEEVQATIEEELRDFETEEALQDAVIHHMFTLMTGNADGLNVALQDVTSWREKIEACVRIMLPKVAQSAQYARVLIEAAYMRIRQARFHKVNPRQLRSRLVLLHAVPMSYTSPATMLQRYSQQPVEAHQLRAPLAYATQDPSLAAIINRHLDDHILEAFENRNICYSYLYN